MPICAVKWSRRRQALAVEASRTVGDALMQLPRHCRVSPLLLPHTTPTPTPPPPPPPPPHTGRRAHDGALSSAAPWSQARSRLPGNRGAVEESSLVLFISAEPRGICHRRRVHLFTSLTAALLCGVLEVAKTRSNKRVPECNNVHHPSFALTLTSGKFLATHEADLKCLPTK